MKKIVIFALLSAMCFSLYASDIVRKFDDSNQEYITLNNVKNCIEVNPYGDTLFFEWSFYLTDEYAEFRFWWPDGRRMSAPALGTDYTITIVNMEGREYSFDGYTPDSYVVRVTDDSFGTFCNALYENREGVMFHIIQHDYRSEVAHSPMHTYLMPSIDASNIDRLFRLVFGKSLYEIEPPKTDSTDMMLGFFAGPSLVPAGNSPEEANARFGLEYIYFPYRRNTFGLGVRGDISAYQWNLGTGDLLFDMSVALYMSNYFFINDSFSLRLEYGVGAAYIMNPAATRYSINSLSIRVPLALSFVIRDNWNIVIDIICDIIPAIGYTPLMVGLATGGVSFRYGF